MLFKCLENQDSESVDVIISTLPWTITDIPLMAPAVLKPMISKAGLSSKCVDLNAEVYNLTNEHPDQDHLIKFFFDGIGHPLVNDWLEDLFESAARDILKWNPKFIGFSLFSYVSRTACQWLCYYLKQQAPDVKIIIGGAGCLEQFTGPSDFANTMLINGLADYHIRGDGENALYQLLIGNTTYPGINSPAWQEITRQELEQLPLPNYDDYNFSQYKKKMLGIHGSRGCVRACTFCDYIANWTKFQWRSGQNIFDEMQAQYKKYGIRSFKFHDTLINGNLKEFSVLINLLSDWNKQHPDEKFTWGGYYIFREQSDNDDKMWQTLADSGASILMVGIENLNEDIRYHIGKKFSNASIDYHLSKALEHNIMTNLLFIVGYVYETQAHIDFAKKWLDTHTEYKSIIMIQWGGSLGIFPNTYLERNKDTLGVAMIGPKPNLWVNQSIGSTPAVRAKWVRDLVEHSRQLGYSVTDDIDNHFILEQLINVKC